MAAVDEVRWALEQFVPDFSGRAGDWDGVLEKARVDGSARRISLRWPVAAGAAVAAAAALVLFWPVGGKGEGVLARARAAVEGGPVTHVVVHGTPIKVYDLKRHEYRDLPVVDEEWFDPTRGLGPPGRFHYVRRVGESPTVEFVGGTGVRLPDGKSAEFAGIATAYRYALDAEKATLGAEETVQGRRVYWVRFSKNFGLRPGQYEVAVDAETFEPRFLRVNGGSIFVLEFETLPSGEGKFTITPRRFESSTWSGTSQLGPRSPEEAREALKNALWLGERLGNAPLSSIREVRWVTHDLERVPQPLRVLELCYGSPGEDCSVSMTETTQPNGTAAGGKGWPFAPPPNTLGFGDAPGLGYVMRDGVWVTLQTRSRDELIKAAGALRVIPPATTTDQGLGR